MEKLVDLNAEVARLNKKLLNQIVRVARAKPSGAQSDTLRTAAKILEVVAPKAVSISGRVKTNINLSSVPARKFRSKSEAQRAISLLNAAIKDKRVTIAYHKKLEDIKVKKTLDWVYSEAAADKLDVRLSRRDALRLWELYKSMPSDSNYNYADVTEAYLQVVKVKRQAFDVDKILERARALAPVVQENKKSKKSKSKSKSKNKK